MTHQRFALRWGVYLIVTGMISILHGIFPFLLPFEAPRRVMRVAKMILTRGNMDEIPEEDRIFWSKITAKD